MLEGMHDTSCMSTQQGCSAPVIVKEATSLPHPQFPGSFLALHIHCHRIYLHSQLCAFDAIMPVPRQLSRPPHIP